MTTTPTPSELWTRQSILKSNFAPSTIMMNHFLVLAHTPDTILLRCGDSPLTNPHQPRESDGLFALSALPNYEKGYVEFRLTSIFYDGTRQLTDDEKQIVREGKGQELRPVKGFMEWAHREYAKGMMESGCSKVRMSKWRSMDKQRELIREEMKREKAERDVAQGKVLEEPEKK
jgi:hypothetical protein